MARRRSQLDHALGKPGRTLVLGDIDHESAMLSVRNVEPLHLLHIARMLIEQARDAFEGQQGNDAEHMVMRCDDALASLPDPHEDSNG